MFNLIKIEYGRDNVPEPLQLPATASVQYKIGTALKITSGAAAIATGDANVEYICLENKTGVSGDKILCFRVTPQMIFETVLGASTVTNADVGAKLQLSTAGDSVTDTAVETYFGAMIEDTLGATAKGDKVLVRLA